MARVVGAQASAMSRELHHSLRRVVTGTSSVFGVGVDAPERMLRFRILGLWDKDTVAGQVWSGVPRRDAKAAFSLAHAFTEVARVQPMFSGASSHLYAGPLIELHLLGRSIRSPFDVCRFDVVPRQCASQGEAISSASPPPPLKCGVCISWIGLSFMNLLFLPLKRDQSTRRLYMRHGVRGELLVGFHRCFPDVAGVALCMVRFEDRSHPALPSEFDPRANPARTCS